MVVHKSKNQIKQNKDKGYSITTCICKSCVCPFALSSFYFMMNDDVNDDDCNDDDDDDSNAEDDADDDVVPHFSCWQSPP